MLHRRIATGDHITIWRGMYAHHGIYVGAGMVIHYWGGKDEKGASCVQLSSLDDFVGASGANALDVVDYARCFPAQTVLARAYGQLGVTGWNALRNNCEHFARWCKTGDQRSVQADAAIAVGRGTATSGLATATAVGVVSGAGAVAGLSGSGILSGLASVGGAVGGGAVAGVAALSVGPAVAATIALRRAFRDDAALPMAERHARETARRASVGGAVAGTVGSIAAISAAGAVPGLSGAGVATGLAAIGGSMAGGVAVALAVPALGAAVVAYLAYRNAKRNLASR